MARYVALVRGINVGGHRRVSMGDLRGLTEALGHEDVRTYVQSGNVLFTSSARSERKLEEGFEKAIAKELGHEVRVMVRSASHLERIITENPYGDRKPEPKQLHVVFLADKPKAADVRSFDTTAYEPDEVTAMERDLYVYLPNGAGQAKLTNAILEKRLGVPGTMRNWRTVTTLADMLAG